MNHLEKSVRAGQAPKSGFCEQDVPLMKLRDVIGKISEWGKDYPIFLTLQVRSGGLRSHSANLERCVCGPRIMS